MDDTTTIESKYQALSARLDEAALRAWAAAEAQSLGRGGVSLVAKATGMSRTTIHAGLLELKRPPSPPLAEGRGGRVRSAGGGRKKAIDKDSSLTCALDALIEPAPRGDTTPPLRWTCKSTRRLAEELQAQGHAISQRTVCDLLGQAGFSLQSTRKTREGGEREDRDAQFAHLARTIADYQAAGDPVITVDSRKKTLSGDAKDAGEALPSKETPEEADIDDANTGWVSIGIDPGTAEFAVDSIRRWWREMGEATHPQARRLMIAADCGGNNENRARLWRSELQKLADELRLTLQVCHLPPGTRRWNRIEHRMVCHITADWRDRPLASRQVVINLIGGTSQAGLPIKAADAKTAPPAGAHGPLHSGWNYGLAPRDTPV